MQKTCHVELVKAEWFSLPFWIPPSGWQSRIVGKRDKHLKLKSVPLFRESLSELFQLGSQRTPHVYGAYNIFVQKSLLSARRRITSMNLPRSSHEPWGGEIGGGAIPGQAQDTPNPEKGLLKQC